VKVLVTGGGGFIGSNLGRALVQRGDEVRVLDNFSTGNRTNLAELANEVEVVEGELRSYERVHAATRGVEVVFHQGALPSVPRSVQDPLTTGAVNVEGTLNVLLAARDEGVRRIVFASSSSVYGNSGDLPRIESSNPDPISPYGVSKLAAERYCVSFSRVYALETVALRYFNVFGPNQDPTSQYSAVIPRFLTAIADGRPVSIYGDGGQQRDFTYVDNVVEANLLAAEAKDASGAVLNIATGRPTSVNQLADVIGTLLDRTVEREQHPARAGDVRDSWADIGRAREVLGWEPRVSLETGLRLAAEAFVSRSVPAQEA
jgi:UDP-glucose 4-epimerase